MKSLVIQWLVGLTISLGIGQIVTWGFLKCLRSCIKIPEGIFSSERFKGVPPWLIGTIERIFFTFIVAFDISGFATAMILWIATKMLSGWHRAVPGIRVRLNDEEYELNHRDIVPVSFSSLLGNLVSMFFALIGGLICQGRIWW
ncbi:MAG: hypothetical protein ABIJ37_03245 [Pseudomonadota bacterium]